MVVVARPPPLGEADPTGLGSTHLGGGATREIVLADFFRTNDCVQFFSDFFGTNDCV